MDEKATMPAPQEQPVTNDPEFFGGCPVCGKNDGYLNVGRCHWFMCDEHKTKWLRGANLFSSWRHETEADWEKNHERIKGYKEVTPRFA